MEYVTSIERLAMEEGREEGREENAREMLIDLLQVRFGSLPNNLIEQLNQIEDISRLKALHREAIGVDSLYAFQQLLIGDDFS